MALSQDVEKQRRHALLCGIGHRIATILSKAIKERYGIDGAITFNDKAIALDACVSDYVTRLSQLRDRKGFCGGESPDRWTIAGLMVLVLLERKPIDLFRLDDALRGKGYATNILPIFIYRVISEILVLDLARVDRDVENDLLRCIVRYPHIKADPDWLFWSLRVFQIAYGNPDLGRNDSHIHRAPPPPTPGS